MSGKVANTRPSGNRSPIIANPGEAIRARHVEPERARTIVDRGHEGDGVVRAEAGPRAEGGEAAAAGSVFADRRHLHPAIGIGDEHTFRADTDAEMRAERDAVRIVQRHALGNRVSMRRRDSSLPRRPAGAAPHCPRGRFRRAPCRAPTTAGKRDDPLLLIAGTPNWSKAPAAGHSIAGGD